MELLYIEGGIVKPTPEAISIDVFNKIWNNDKSPLKEVALCQFSFIKFMYQPGDKNPYYGYPIEIRASKINERLAHKVDPNDPDIVMACAYFDKEVEDASPSKRYYDACVTGAEKNIEFLRSVNYEERDAKGSAVYKPIDVDRILKSAFETLQSLHNMKKKVDEEIYESAKTKGNRIIGAYENPKNRRRTD